MQNNGKDDPILSILQLLAHRSDPKSSLEPIQFKKFADIAEMDDEKPFGWGNSDKQPEYRNILSKYKKRAKRGTLHIVHLDSFDLSI